METLDGSSAELNKLSLVKDKYRLIKLVSHGSYGPIYFAKHEVKGYSLVMKYVSKPLQKKKTHFLGTYIYKIYSLTLK